jgi:hypothetical protein
MNQPLAAAIAAAAFTFAMQVEKPQPDALPPTPAARLAPIGMVLFLCLVWAIDAPSIATAATRVLEPIGAAALGQFAGQIADAQWPAPHWRKRVIWICLLLAIGSCSIGFGDV